MSAELKLSEARHIKRQDILFSLARVPGTERVFLGSSDFHVYSADLSDEKAEPQPLKGDGHSSYVSGMALCGEQLVSGAWDRHLIWWNAETGEAIRKVEAHDKWVRDVVASPDGKVVASVGDDMVCRLWEVASGKLIQELRGHEPETPHGFVSMLFTCAFHPDGKLLATADKTGRIVIWEVASGREVKRLEAPVMYTWDPDRRRHSIGGVRSLIFSPDGGVLVAGGMGKVDNIDHLGGKARLRAFDWEKGETLAEIEADSAKGLVERMAFGPGGKWLLAAGGDHKGFQLVIDPAEWKVTMEESASFHIHDFALNETSDRLFLAGHQAVATHEVKG